MISSDGILSEYDQTRLAEYCTCQYKIVVCPTGDLWHMAHELHKPRENHVFIRTTANLSIIILPVGRRV